MATKPPQPVAIELPPLTIQAVQLTVVGDSPLIVHRWSEKALKAMRDKQQKRARAAKEAKDPEAEFRASLYRLPDGRYAFPAIAFKAAAVGACRFVDGLKMVGVRGAFHVVGELVAIEGEPIMREDPVRVGMGTADLRYRGEFKTWRATLDLRINAAVLSVEQVVHLLNLGGFGVGVGEWRPEKDGSNGRFHVETETEAQP